MVAAISSLADKISNRIRARGRGSVFTPGDFLDLGTRANVDQTLARLVARGVTRKLARGLYDYPVLNPHLGAISPSPDQIARALARGDAVQVPGPVAANQLGLTTQVAARAIYLTKGSGRTARVGVQTIVLKHSKRLPGAGKTAGSVYQALRWLGPSGTTPAMIDKLKRQLSDGDKREIAKIIIQSPAWMRATLGAIAS